LAGIVALSEEQFMRAGGLTLMALDRVVETFTQEC
jgi:hypothetical protein